EDGIRDKLVTGVQTCALPISRRTALARFRYAARSSAVASMWRRIESEITLSPSSRLMPRTPMDVRPANTRTSGTAKRMHWPPARSEERRVGKECGYRGLAGHE